SAHPNAGLPNAFGEYDESPGAMRDFLQSWLDEGLVNIVGGCCGTTPDHIAAIAQMALPARPRALPQRPARLRLSGLEALNIGAETLFVNIGERTNVTGSAKFRRLVTEGRFDAALDVARQQVDSGAQ